MNATAGILYKFLDEFEFLTAADSDHPGYKHCITLRDSFLVHSKHGPLIYLVTDVLGMDLSYLRHSQDAFPTSVVKRITRQTLLALDYLHRECHIVHTGELRCSYHSTQPIQLSEKISFCHVRASYGTKFDS